MNLHRLTSQCTGFDVYDIDSNIASGLRTLLSVPGVYIRRGRSFRECVALAGTQIAQQAGVALFSLVSLW